MPVLNKIYVYNLSTQKKKEGPRARFFKKEQNF